MGVWMTELAADASIEDVIDKVMTVRPRMTVLTAYAGGEVGRLPTSSPTAIQIVSLVFVALSFAWLSPISLSTSKKTSEYPSGSSGQFA
jgi:hypothetical protein